MNSEDKQRPRLLAERFVERMSDDEYARAARVARALPAIAERSAEADRTARFHKRSKRLQLFSTTDSAMSFASSSGSTP